MKQDLSVQKENQQREIEVAEQNRQRAVAIEEERVTRARDIEIVAREREVLVEQAKESGKPQEIAEKMVEGRIRKYYQEVVLMEQTFVIDGESKVADVVAKAGKDAGADIKMTGFAQFILGDGIEKEEADFAAEVAAQLGN